MTLSIKTKRAFRPKILPVLIVVAMMALPFKIGAPWLEGGDTHEALAQEKTEAGDGASDTSLAEETPEPPASDDGATVARMDAQGTGDPEPEGEAAASVDLQRASLSPNPFELTDQEIELLQSLAARREALDQREGDIEQRESVLAAAEARIEEKISQLEGLKSEIESLLAEQEKRQTEKIASLARIYTAMKPKDAARIFESLDMKVLLEVVDTMQERTSAAILAKMNPQRVQAITLQLAQRDRLPGSD